MLTSTPAAAASPRLAKHRQALPRPQSAACSRPRPVDGTRRLRSATRAAAPAARQQEQWDACVSTVSALGFGADEADVIVRKAYGWGFQAYWRKERDHQQPDAEGVSAAVAFLRELGLTDEQLNKAVRVFPEVLGCSVDALLRPNAAHLAKSFHMPPDAVAATVARKPQVLGNKVDCAGDCVGECNRCWARF